MSVTVTAVGGRLGGVVITDIDMVKPMLAALPGIKRNIVAAGAVEMRRAIKDVYQTDGRGTWEGKSEEQTAYSGSDKLMRGITRELSNGIEVKANHNDVSPHPFQRLVGWFDDEHPDPGVLGDARQTRPLTKGELAWVHELGVARGGNVPGVGMGYGSIFRVPPRPWATMAADQDGGAVLDFMVGGFVTALSWFAVPLQGFPATPSGRGIPAAMQRAIDIGSSRALDAAIAKATRRGAS